MDPHPALVFVMDISREFNPAEVSVGIVPVQILDLEREVVLPRVAQEFVSVLQANRNPAEIARALGDALEHHQPVERLPHAPNGGQGLVVHLVGMRESAGQSHGFAHLTDDL